MSIVSFKEKKCIYGEKISGGCREASEDGDCVRLLNAKGTVCKECGNKSNKNAECYRDLFTRFCGERGADISASRLYGYPKEGYEGYRHGVKRRKKPTKAGKHINRYELRGIPALCFTDFIGSIVDKVSERKYGIFQKV